MLFRSELEEDRLLAEKPVQEAFMTENKSRGAQGSGRNKDKGKGSQGKGGNEAGYSGQKRKRGKRAGKKARTRIALIVVNLVTLLVITLSQR